MKKLYAPWRAAYTKRVHTNTLPDTCIFCTIAASPHADAQEFVLKRFEHCMVMLNKYPYNPGHLMVVPYAHHETLHSYNASVRTELMEQVSGASEILQRTLSADGCNIGINMGKAAGAGIPEHLHIHVLPRFFGDTNFLPTLSDTKQISIDLHEIYAELATVFAKL